MINNVEDRNLDDNNVDDTSLDDNNVINNRMTCSIGLLWRAIS